MMRKLLITLMLLSMLLALPACGGSAPAPAPSAQAPAAEEPAAETAAAPVPAAETLAAAPAKKAAAPTATPEPEWRELTQAELDELNASLDWSENGFFVTNYSRPEEIDWHEVFYNGAGLKRSPTKSELAEYERRVAPAMTSIVCIPRAAVESFVWEKTGTLYSEARHPLDWYVTDSDCFMTQHGDTNVQAVEFTSGRVCGDEYELIYPMGDYKHYRFEGENVMRARIADGKWTYRSNLPADAVAPLDLLDIHFVETQKEAILLGTRSFVKVEQLPSDEPFGWCWAVLTAKEDGVRYVLDRIQDEDELDFRFSIDYGIVRPGENISSGVLDKGESTAVWVNLPWYPTVRLMATKDAWYGEYLFGSDNGLHLDREVPRYVIGHDLDGEHRGVTWRNEADLVSFLADGAWVWMDEDSGKTLGAVRFCDYRAMEVDDGEQVYRFFLNYDRIYSGEDEAPDLLVTRKYDKNDYCWTLLPSWFGDNTGDYLVSAIQLDGEQLLTLTQANNGEGALNWVLPEAGANQHEFTLIRCTGTAVFEGQG